ncbi:MAG: SPOR domain-containing protein [Burkholderiaceae bacterium]|nr:SPOR domain-containing protein [Burkholderiaceae bacterium]
MRSRRTRAARSAGGTLLGFMIGLVTGLTVAVVVAIFVTRAPVPFVNRAAQTAERLEPRTAAEAPDPNQPLHSRVKPETEAGKPAADGAGARPPGTQATGAATGQAAQGAVSYLLQAGAFRSVGDADAMRAKLALVGFEARVVQAQVGGQALFRVRVGPYAQLDDMNRVRAKLAEAGIEASVVRQK